MTYLVTLTKVKGGKNVRTDVVKGISHELPTVGQSFGMLAPPLEEGGIIRMLRTSHVEMVVMSDADRQIDFTTETGSVYSLTFDRE